MIEKMTEQTKQAILRKTPFAHGTRPSDEGMPAQQVKRLFYAAIADEDNSIFSEMERMRQQANGYIATKADAADVVPDLEAHCDDVHIPSTMAVQHYVDKVSNTYRWYYSDISVPAAMWQAMPQPLGDYTHCARIALPHLTAVMVPDVYFAPADVARPQLATFAYCDDGALLLYATDAIQGDVLVQTLVCSAPTCFCLLVQAPHCRVTVRDSRGTSYAHGDAVAVGTVLTVDIAADSGYTVQGAQINGQTVDLSALPYHVTVAGSVRVQADVQEVTLC